MHDRVDASRFFYQADLLIGILFAISAHTRVQKRFDLSVDNEDVVSHERPKGIRNMAKYSKKASKKVEKAMRERKKGTLKSGRSGKKVTSKKQAIAIGLSQARKEGAKVPPKKSSSKKR